MKFRYRVTGLALVAMAATAGMDPVCAAGGGSAAPTTERSATRALVRRLKATGRAQAVLYRTVVDPLSRRRETVRGELVLELPDRAALRFPATGERVTLRADGGEWIQPQLSQMLVLGPERATAALRWWAMLLPERDSRMRVHRLGADRFVLIAANGQGSPGDSAWVWLDREGLPKRLEMREEQDAKSVYNFSGWRFSRPRGRAAFVLAAPRGYQVVKLP